MRSRKGLPWVMRLPGGLRDQPAQIFIGGLFALAGLSYMLGIAESNSITQVLDPTWLRVWGGFLLLSGVLVIWSTWCANRPLERMALRFMSLGLLMYIGWILAAVPFVRAVFTLALVACLIVLSEIRVAVIKVLLRPTPDPGPGVGE